MNYSELRETYHDFKYKSFDIEENDKKVKITYHFQIEGLEEFSPYWEFPKKTTDTFCYKESTLFQNMVFSLGMVELVSYWKICCPKTVHVQAGALNTQQIAWWKELYFHGLGESYDNAKSKRILD